MFMSQHLRSGQQTTQRSRTSCRACLEKARAKGSCPCRPLFQRSNYRFRSTRELPQEDLLPLRACRDDVSLARLHLNLILTMSLIPHEISLSRKSLLSVLPPHSSRSSDPRPLMRHTSLAPARLLRGGTTVSHVLRKDFPGMLSFAVPGVTRLYYSRLFFVVVHS